MVAATRTLASLVKLEHTVFALPFAYAGMLLAVAASEAKLVPSLVLWITAAMVGARTLAMAFNRLADTAIDARNPRTAGRELPSGRLRAWQVWLLCAASLALLVAATFQLDPITRVLWPIPVALFVLYPYTKRFTWLCHLVLGVSIGLAAAGAWLAVTGELSLVAVLLSAAIALWIGGFDVIYATQDIEVDRTEKLHSLPARFGIARALLVTRVAHAATFALLAWVGLASDLGAGYWVGLALVGALLAYENAIVSERDLSRVNAAFFTANGVIGMLFLAGVAAGLAWR